MIKRRIKRRTSPNTNLIIHVSRRDIRIVIILVLMCDVEDSDSSSESLAAMDRIRKMKSDFDNDSSSSNSDGLPLTEWVITISINLVAIDSCSFEH